MKRLKKVLIYIGIFLLLFLIVGLILPSKVHVERSSEIAGSPEMVYEQIANLKNWPKWSPWHNLDPQMKIEYYGPEEGVGAGYKWFSNHSNVGNGDLKITKVEKPGMIETLMVFGDNGSGVATYRIEKTEKGSKVVWGMDSDSKEMPFYMRPIAGYFNLFMDKMVGPDFERGLRNLDSVCKTLPPPVNTGMVKSTEIKEYPETKYLYVNVTATEETISDVIGNSFGTIGEYMEKMKAEHAGAPFCIYYNYEKTFNFDACIPVKNEIKGDKTVKYKVMPAGTGVVAMYYGNYMYSGKGHDAANEFITKNSKKITGSPWEVYVTDPGTEKDTAKFLTEVWYPIAK